MGAAGLPDAVPGGAAAAALSALFDGKEQREEAKEHAAEERAEIEEVLHDENGLGAETQAIDAIIDKIDADE